MTHLFRDSLNLPTLKLRRIGLSGRMMLGLGGIAACAAFITYRTRARPHRDPAVTPSRIPEEPASQDVAMPASPDSGTEPQDKAWMDTLRLAMETEPMQSGFDKKAWTSPMLAEYLTKATGIAVPVPRIRLALKELGYRWKGTHYVPVGDGNPKNS